MPSGPRFRRLPEASTFFVDRSLGGKILADALKAAGERIEIHDDHFPKDATDELWLAKVCAKGWVILSKDDRIRRNPVERQAARLAHRGRRRILPGTK
jgi:hypothetical protein